MRQTIHRAVYRTDGDASLKLYLSQPAACDKSEAELALDVLYYRSY